MNTEQQTVNHIVEAIGEYCEEYELDYEFETKENAGILTNDNGIVYTDDDGRKFWITVKQL